MNDYAGLAYALLKGAGIGDLPPIVQPQLLRDRQLIEVMPKWRLRTVNLWLVHLGNRPVSQASAGSADLLEGPHHIV
jgi:DNA-binding transcriptional LysR family regulator